LAAVMDADVWRRGEERRLSRLLRHRPSRKWRKGGGKKKRRNRRQETGKVLPFLLSLQRRRGRQRKKRESGFYFVQLNERCWEKGKEIPEATSTSTCLARRGKGEKGRLVDRIAADHRRERGREREGVETQPSLRLVRPIDRLRSVQRGEKKEKGLT